MFAGDHHPHDGASHRRVRSGKGDVGRLNAKLADAAGIEFLLPIARWIGYGGETDFHGSVLETLTWATGLLAHTKRINIFATVHTAFIHPVVAASNWQLAISWVKAGSL